MDTHKNMHNKLQTHVQPSAGDVLLSRRAGAQGMSCHKRRAVPTHAKSCEEAGVYSTHDVRRNEAHEHVSINDRTSIPNSEAHSFSKSTVVRNHSRTRYPNFKSHFTTLGGSWAARPKPLQNNSPNHFFAIRVLGGCGRPLPSQRCSCCRCTRWHRAVAPAAPPAAPADAKPLPPAAPPTSGAGAETGPPSSAAARWPRYWQVGRLRRIRIGARCCEAVVSTPTSVVALRAPRRDGLSNAAWP